jgi:hypothetical protein
MVKHQAMTRSNEMNDNADDDVGLINVISSMISQCAPDSGWISDDGQGVFEMPDGTSITVTIEEYEDAADWIEKYDEMSVKYVTEYNGIEFSDEEVDEHLQEAGGLIHFNFDIKLSDGLINYEFAQFGEGEIAGESVELTGISENDALIWGQFVIAEAWQANS